MTRAMDQPDHLASVRQGYDRWAAVYDRDGNPLPALEEPYVREAVGDVRGGNFKRVAPAVGEGSMAVQFVHEHLAAPASRVG